LGEEGHAKPYAEVLGIQKGGGEFAKGRRSPACGEQDFFLKGMKTDGKQQSGGDGDRAGGGQEPNGRFQE